MVQEAITVKEVTELVSRGQQASDANRLRQRLLQP